MTAAEAIARLKALAPSAENPWRNPLQVVAGMYGAPSSGAAITAMPSGMDLMRTFGQLFSPATAQLGGVVRQGELTANRSASPFSADPLEYAQASRSMEDLAGGLLGKVGDKGELKAAVRFGGKVYTGPTHIAALKTAAADGAVDLSAPKLNQEAGDTINLFQKPDGTLITRDEAGEMYGGAKRTEDINALDQPAPAAAPIAAPAPTRPTGPTVMRPKQVVYPDIYQNPKTLVAEAASRVAPENPLLKQLFGVSRDDLYDIGQQGTRVGNAPEIPFKTAVNPKGAAIAGDVTNPRNTQRMINIIDAARGQPDLFKGMSSWYVMDPMYQRMLELHGGDADAAKASYNQLNSLMGMASPGSEVLSEINRGSAANMMATQGRFPEFKQFGGIAESARGADFPPEMQGVIAHPYHSTAHAGPMEKYLQGGAIDMGSAKVPSYIGASGVPETGFQTQWPVGDAHWSRLVGLPDVRPAGKSGPNPAAASVPEMVSLSPWWRDKVAAQSGLEAVPAQAVVWGAGSGATGVTSPIGATKLEMIAQQLGETAKRMGISPEEARDRFLMGKAYAGEITPELAAALGLGSGAAAAAAPTLADIFKSAQQQPAQQPAAPDQ